MLDRTVTYRVAWSEVVEPRRIDVLDSTATRSLTLVTCYPFAYVGHAPLRFVVRARQVEALTERQPPPTTSMVSRDAESVRSEVIAHSRASR